MRSRSLAANAAEIGVPALAALVIGIVALVLLGPGLSLNLSSNAGVVRIYASVPLNDFASIVHGAQMAIDEAGGKAGSLTLDYVPLNDAKTVGGNWDGDVELANARRAAADPAALAYIGTYNSGAAKISIPVLNRVHLAMISPGNTYPGLTKPGTGTAGEPWIYYPLGPSAHNYFRVVPADDLQGAAGAAYARQVNAHSVYVLDDTELYGHGIAVIFAQNARTLGLTVAGGPESIDIHATDYTALAQKIVAQHPDLVYFGGVAANHPAAVLRDLRRAGFTGAFMGADGLISDRFSREAQDAGALGQGAVYATLVGLPADKLTGAGATWYQNYLARWPNDDNKDFAPFGYEAARVAIHAITQVGRIDREAVRAAVAATKSSDLGGSDILGSWQFDANGDTSLVTISVQQLNGTTWAYQGLMSYNPATKAWSFRAQ